MGSLALVGGARFDSSTGEFVDNSSTVIEGGHISSFDDLPRGYSGAQVDCSGKYLFPGLINLHEHFTFRATKGSPARILREDQNRQVVRSVRNAHLSLARGITTVRELGSRYWINNSIRDCISEGIMLGPRVFSAGSPLARTGGHASYISRECDGPIAFRKGVRVLAENRTDWVKVMASDDPVDGFGREHTTPDIRPDELNEVGLEARLRGLKVTAHVMGEQALDWCITAGFDTLEHGVYLTHDLAHRMLEADMSLIPTISSYRRTVLKEFERGSEWVVQHEALVEAHTSSTETAIREGLRLGIGTDSIGEFVEECQILEGLGMTNLECLNAATLNGAAILGASDEIGSIEAGKLADIVVLRADPRMDLANLRDIAYTVAAGAVMKPDDFSAVLTSKEFPSSYF